MKILYISPENTVGTLGLWQRIHRNRGNECRYITYFPSPMGFPDDICLHLPLISSAKWFIQLRNLVYTWSKGPLGDETPLPGNPPIWEPKSTVERAFFNFRDWLWRFWVEPAIRRYDLLDFDIYHLEWGLEFYRNGSFVERLHKRSKPILCTYHGQDLRHRGVIPAVDRHVQFSLTSEYDLISRHPNLHYLFLPFDVHAFDPHRELHDPITICHATRNRYAKGSDTIIMACRALERSHGVRFILIENQSHEVTMRLKGQADIYIDQVANVGPGYGMNSVEAMALGLACCTDMDENYQAFMPDHPFVQVTRENLLERLTGLVEAPHIILERGTAARQWAETHHALDVTGDRLYGYYRELGIV
ncbi:MAG: hypothetical protein ACETWG_07355 [Candidatus Neomarinimicrobiota bacterium]